MKPDPQPPAQTVTVQTTLYAATDQDIDGLAAECYGKLLQADGFSESISFAFNGADGAENAVTFQILLDTTFRKKPAPKKRTRKNP